MSEKTHKLSSLGNDSSTQLSTHDSQLFPPVRGKLRANADIARNTWFQVGGAAEWLFKPEDTEDLALFLRSRLGDLPVTIIGVGSNVLVRDGGVPGVVVRLGRGFTKMEVVQRSTLNVGAACLDIHVARFACDHGIGGLEFLSGVPGTIGGAVVMNAGAYGSDVSQVLVSVEAIDAQGNLHILSKEQLDFGYRRSALPEGWIVTAAMLQGVPGDKAATARRMQEIQQAREDTQPVRTRTGGSTFKNPPGHKAWELIDAAGCRGLQWGGAQVSEKHCNFLINTGTATAADLENLGEEVRERVMAHSGIALEWEIRRIGRQITNNR